MLNLLPASVSTMIDPWLTAVGAMVYVLYGIRFWRGRPWRLRLLYLLGGAVLVLDEFDMLWWIEGIGLALIVSAILGASGVTSTAQPGPASTGRNP
ncbi:MAG: hypothetical protein M0Z54_11850 [Thermaerobacter sp.]|nr:hypothetical protein [Thermaerobacter sp.]